MVVQEVGQRMTLLDFVTDAEYADVLEGVKDLLIETYRITDDEALNILGQSRGKRMIIYTITPCISITSRKSRII
ncbi:hypothetical protein LJK88_40920 [Paenibacillus sp. P26]|nr:hypothetical protein LJK88_40920 [Paenibacillus sp. P26]UUZ92821.1 hypothetical protein LJK87_47395 [Paenibacillus sp. P25]